MRRVKTHALALSRASHETSSQQARAYARRSFATEEELTSEHTTHEGIVSIVCSSSTVAFLFRQRKIFVENTRQVEN